MRTVRSGFRLIALLSLTMLTGILASCSSGSSGGSIISSTESLHIYETIASTGSFTAVAGDSTGANFQLTLGNVPKDILWFSDRPGQDAGYDTLSNVISNVWPRVYGTVAPNALLKGTIANQGYIEIFCVLNKPVYNVTTGQLDFTITYLDGNQKPVSNLAITDVKLIILNNATTQTEEWSQLMTGDIGTFEPTSTAGTYTFRIQKTIGDVFSYTGAPAQKMSRVSVKAFIQNWQTRFGVVPPNVSIAYNPQNNAIGGGVQIATLTNPVYNESTGSLSFTAKILYGTMPISNGMIVNGPSLFIDAGNGEYIDFPKDVSDIPGDTVFAIQYRNSTTEKISVILVGNKPPCSKDQAVAGKCDPTPGLNSESKFVDDSTAWAAKWTNMSSAFKASGTKFYILTPTSNGSYSAKATPVATKTNLEKNQILRIVLPLVDKIPQWYYNGWKLNNGIWEQKPISSGITTWVTPVTDNLMFAPESVMLFEFFPCSGQIYNDDKNLFENADKKLWFNLSAVDGVNARVTMKYGGTGIPSQSLKSDASLEPYSDTNPDGCPYSQVHPTFNTLTCVSPKHYPDDADLGRIDGQPTKRTLTGTDGNDVILQIPSWVVGSDKFTQADVNAVKYKVVQVQDSKDGPYTTYQDFYNTYASTTTGLQLAAAGSADKFQKVAYHIWWSTNSVGQAWLKYLQGNKKSDAYGWAYDEMKWIPGPDTSPGLKFDFNGNPGPNTDPVALRKSDYAVKDGYLNIDILQVMK